MAKQKYEVKKLIQIVGRLDKNENNEYFITVEDKDDIQEYELSNILSEMEGTIINLTSEDIQ